MRSLFVLATCAVLSLGVAAPANADFFTSEGDLWMVDPDGPSAGPPIRNIKELIGGGRAYTNSITATVGPNANTLQLGDVIQTVSIDVIGSALNGFEQPVEMPDANSVVIAGVLRGTVVGFGGPLGTTPIIDFNGSGSRVLVLSGGDAVNPADPSTLPAINILPAAGDLNPLAEYVIKPRENVFPGSEGRNIAVPAALVNLSTPDELDATKTEANLLFREDSTAVENANNIPGTNDAQAALEGLAKTGGDNFLFDVAQPLGVNPIEDEGVLVQPDQVILVQGLQIDAGDLARLNEYFNYVFGAGADFASGIGGGGAGLDFDPFGGALIPTFANFNGDFQATFTNNTFIGAQVQVPEPSSFVVFGVGFGLIGGWHLRRKRKARKAAERDAA